MKTITPIIVILVLLAGGCRQEAGKEAGEAAPKTVEEYTQAIIREVQKVILSTDQQLQGYPPELREAPAGEGQPSPILQMWAEEGNPVRLTATGADGSELYAFYFANGELFFATQPGARCIFIGQQLKYLLDESWKPIEAPEQERQELEAKLLKAAEGYLGAFD